MQGVSVEAVDPVFQAKMLDMLKQTGRPEMVVGWYHSHPGFGCWLSGVDINTQQSFEALSDRAVAVVVDPIQSVKGKAWIIIIAITIIIFTIIIITSFYIIFSFFPSSISFFFKSLVYKTAVIRSLTLGCDRCFPHY